MFHSRTVPWKIGAILTLLVVVATACTSTNDSRPEPRGSATCDKFDTASFGIISASAAYWIPIYAQHAGLWKDECIEYDPVQIPDGTAIITAITTGDIDVGGVPTDIGVAAVEAGHGVAIVGSIQVLNNASIVAAPDIKGYPGLAGKTIGVAGLTTGSTLMVKTLLAANGLEQGEYDFISSGGTSERRTALQARAFAATWLHPPEDLRMAEEGYTILGSLNEAFPVFQYASFFMSRSWAADHRDLAVRILKVFVTASKRFQDEQYRDDFEQVLVDEVKVSPELAKATYQKYKETNAMSPDAGISVKGLFEVMELMKSVKQLAAVPTDASVYADMSYWSEASGQPEPNLKR